MAELIDGFDIYPGFGTNDGGFLQNWSWISTTSGRAFIAGRFGGQALRINDGSGTTGSARRALPGSPWVNFSAHFAYRSVFLNTGNPFFHVLDTAQAVQLTLQQRSDGAIAIYRGTTIIFTTATGLLTANTWATIEFFGTIADVGGYCELWVNDAQVATFSGDTKQTANTNIGFMQFECPDGTSTGNFADFDDLWMRDVASRPGLQRVSVVAPNADTADKDFVPSTGSANYACVDELPANVTDYVSGSIVGDTDLYGLNTLGTAPASIASAQVVALMGKTDAGSRSIALLADDGTLQQGADVPLVGPTLAWAVMPLPTMPDGSALNYADLSAMKVGMKVTV